MNISILIIDDEAKMGKALRHVLLREGYNVDICDNPQKGLEIFEASTYHLVLCDLRMPGLSGLEVLDRVKTLRPETQVIMMTAYATAETAVDAMKKGAYDYIIKPFAMDELKILIQRCLKEQLLESENERLKDQLQEKFHPANVVSSSKIMDHLLRQAQKVAASSATVLITGESGTGKELLASVIHAASPRAARPLVTINCGAVSETLLESELFGHKRGAFTGAVENRAGLFETADGGTLFLDEVGEVSPAMQVKLLRVLQSGEFQRVGESNPIKVDVRVLSATNRDLQQMINDGLFRADLYYRLNVVPLSIPPLRERREDIPDLIEHFLKRYDPDRRHLFKPATLRLMQEYDWPGNVRELENAVEHAVVLADEDEIGIEALPMALRTFAGQVDEAAQQIPRLEDMTLEEAERIMIRAAMERTNNNMTRAAQELGITRRTMGYRLKKYGLYTKALSDQMQDLEGEEEEESCHTL
ncbi:MAG TPA: sigma-54 dependent transcriptional regulator [Candidatus Sumerlaeota bacterium]|nr:sigma-54 dependent transcriptional regulator [Candidatus Sumerlaeota bacterium]